MGIYYYIYGRLQFTWRTRARAYTITYMVDSTPPGGQELGIYYCIYGRLHFTWRTGVWAHTIIYTVDSASPGRPDPEHNLPYIS